MRRAHRAFVGDVGPRPLNENQKPVLKADKEQNVDERANSTRPGTLKCGSCQTGRRRQRGRSLPDCLCPNSQRGDERLPFPVSSSRRISLATKRPSWMATGATPGSILPFVPLAAAEVSDHENFRMLRNAEVGLYHYPASTVDGNTEFLAERGGRYARRPQYDRRLQPRVPNANRAGPPTCVTMVEVRTTSTPKRWSCSCALRERSSE